MQRLAALWRASSLSTTASRARSQVQGAGNGLMTLLLVLTFAAIAVSFAPGLLGYERYVLVGGSMEPTIHRGSLVFDDVVPVRRLRAGDVITYTPPGRRTPVTHRLISATRRATGGPVFQTQGDANAAADTRSFTLDKPTQARYRFAVPYLGWAFILLGTPQARFILLALPGLLIALAMLGRLRRQSGRLVAERGPA